MKDDLGNRMKEYESKESSRKFIPMLPVLVRLDGKAFHTYTRGLQKPFCSSLIRTMQSTIRELIEKTNASFGYTQSDEISLLYYSDSYDSQIFFDGKINKMISVLASMTTAFFNDYRLNYKDLAKKDFALFDCRAWQLPISEVANYFIWREQDAVRNSVQSVGQANFSHKKLQKKSCKEIQEMLFQEKRINWNAYSLEEKRGTYMQKRKVFTEYTGEELERLPEKHQARLNPDLMIERSKVIFLDNFKRLVNVDNKLEVIFYGSDPKIKKEL